MTRIEDYVLPGAEFAVVPRSVAAELHRLLPFSDIRVKVRGRNSEVDAVLGALRLVALAAGGGSARARTPTRAASYGDGLTTTEAAAEVGVSVRAIRAALAEGRLAGRKVGGRWLVDPAGMTDYKRNMKGQ